MTKRKAKKKAKKKAMKGRKAEPGPCAMITNCTFTQTGFDRDDKTPVTLAEAIRTNAAAALALAKVLGGEHINLTAIDVG